MVASGVRKARAISRGLQPGHQPQGERELRLGAQRRMAAGEDEPQPVIGHWFHLRCAADPRAGLELQQAAWASRPYRDDSRRSRSRALFRAVVVIQPPGLGGTPVAGHRSTATAKASWTASSARSISPKRRTRVATARPELSR